MSKYIDLYNPKRGLLDNMYLFKRYIINLIRHYYYCIFKKGIFIFNGKEYCYFFSRYNFTHNNERVIEVPIFKDFLSGASNKRVLEVGSVLQNYIKKDHVVLDKYDSSSDLNIDIVDHDVDSFYDLIVSISTIEHIGYDDDVDKEKVVTSLYSMIKMLREGGLGLISFPLGYNKNLDLLLSEDRLPFNEVYYLKRESSDNKWTQVDLISKQDIIDSRYGHPFNAANILVIGLISK